MSTISTEVQNEKYTVWWRDGRRCVVEGPCIEEAFARAGYTAGKIKSIEWYDRGDVHTHYWCSATKTWQRCKRAS